jgi:CRISPR system Cascade subunit CasE
MPMVTTLEKPTQVGTMYLSRVRLRRDPSVEALAPLLLPADPADRSAAEHRLLWSVMTDSPDRERDFLFRRQGEREWLVLSRREPLAGHGLFEVETKAWAPILAPGQNLGFALRAHATVDTKDNDRKRQRLDVVMHRLRHVSPGQRALVRDTLAEEAAGDWLRMVGKRAGFHLRSLTQAEYRTERVTRRNGKPLDLGVLDLQGVLTVEESARLVETIAGGLGRCKAFGFGLMLLRRAS